MAENFNRTSTVITTADFRSIYQAPANGNVIVLSCLIANVDAVADATIKVDIVNGSDVEQSKLAHEVIVPSNASLEVIINKLILKGNEKLRCQSDGGHPINATVSVLEIQ
jgi:hypothetical protein